jgi:predicted O-methyltransferase YrrM
VALLPPSLIHRVRGSSTDALAETILSTNTVTDDAGTSYPLHSHTSREQCDVLQRLIHQVRPKTSLEVGLAYGISTLNICQALVEVGATRHIVMDPFQSNWKEIGLRNIRVAGYEKLVEFRREMAHDVLPALVRDKVQVDFAYLDGSKVFDYVLVNVFYLTRILSLGGVMVLDDCDFPGIRKTCQFLAKHPSYEILGAWGASSRKERLPLLRKVLNAIPHAESIFASDLLDTDKYLRGRPHWMAFKKVAEDERQWDWYESF